MIVKTEGIVLKSFDLRETSRIVRFFTKEHGKLSGVLKGIRKDPKKFGSSIDQFTVNDIVYYQHRNSDLHLISQCDLKNFYFPVRQDVKKTLAAVYALELVDRIMPAEEKNFKVYHLLLDYLENLQETKAINILVYIFQLKILSFSGFQPHIDCCVKCSKVIQNEARFSMKDGGLVCPRCPIADSPVSFVSQGTVATILYIEKNSLGQGLRLGLTQNTESELKYILNNFLIYHLGKKTRSEQYLNFTKTNGGI